MGFVLKCASKLDMWRGVNHPTYLQITLEINIYVDRDFERLRMKYIDSLFKGFIPLKRKFIYEHNENETKRNILILSIDIPEIDLEILAH